MMTPGWIGRRKGWLTAESLMPIAGIVIKCLYPCLIFTSVISGFDIKSLLSAWLLPTAAGGILVLGYAVGVFICLWIPFTNEKQKQSFLFQTTVNNYSFFPLALISSLYEPEYVALLIFATLGAEVVIWTLGVFIMNGRRFEIKALKHLLCPALIGMYLAFGCLIIFEFTALDKSLLTDKASWLNHFYSTAETLGAATIPLALTMAGARLAKISIADFHNSYVWIICLLRLLVIPLAAVVLLRLFIAPGAALEILTVIAVMPCSIISVLLSEICDVDKNIINGSVLLSHLLSLITAPVLLYLLLQAP